MSNNDAAASARIFSLFTIQHKEKAEKRLREYSLSYLRTTSLIKFRNHDNEKSSDDPDEPGNKSGGWGSTRILIADFGRARYQNCAMRH